MNNKTATTPCELAANPSGAIQSAPTSCTHRGRRFLAWRTLRSLPLAIMLLAVPAAIGQPGQFGWVQQFPATSPGATNNHSMAYDEARKQVVMFRAGQFPPPGNYVDPVPSQTWVWDGTTWTQKFPANAPTWRGDQAMAYDAARGQVVLFGGLTYGPFGTALADTWVWDGVNWTQKTPVAAPAGRFGSSMTYDARNHVVVMFGGYVPTVYPALVADTWVWDGNNWFQKSPADSPPIRYAHAMAFDAARNQVILFGGIAGGYYTDTWEWDGTNWMSITTPNSPPQLSDFRMASDTANRQVVLFAGNTGYNSWSNETWVFDGANWTKKTPPVVPAGRSAHSMVFDSTKQVIVMFGGTGQDPYSEGGLGFGDTWFYERVTPVTFQATASSATFSVDGPNCQPGSAYTVPTTLLWVPGAVCTVTFTDPVSTGPGAQFVFERWGDGTRSSSRSFTAPSSPTTFDVRYEPQFYLTLTTSPVAAGTASGGGWYTANTYASISATPTPGYIFTGWTGSVNSTTASSTTVFMGQARAVTANFDQQLVPVTITSATAQATFSATGTGCAPGSYAVPQTLQWMPGSNCTVSFATPVSGASGTQYVFTGWADGATGSARTVTAPAAATTYTGVYKTQYQLTLTANPSAGGTVSAGGFFDAGAMPTVTATANTGYTFTGWSGAVAAASASSTTVSMTQPQAVTANFTQLVPVTINSATAQATFSVSGTGCAPGSYAVPQTLSWTPGAACTVSFTSTVAGAAGTQYVFTGWADGVTGTSRTIATPAAATTYTATYKTQYQLTLTANPIAGGTVSAGGFFDAGATPTVTATINAGYAFSGWSGPVAAASASSTTVSMTQPQTLTANFVQLVPVTITSAIASATFSVTGVGCAPASYAVPQTLEWMPGSTCTVSFATPISGGAGTQYVFTGWADGATGNSRALATPAAATTYTAVYKTQYQLTLAVSPAGTGVVAGAGFYDANTSAGFSAPAAAGYQFTGWTPALSPNTASASVVMTSPRSITATFALISILSVSPAAGQYSDSVTLSATVGPAGAAVSGSLQFQLDGMTVGSPVLVNGSGTYTSSYVIGASAGSHAITAAFVPASPFVLGSLGGNSLTVTREDAATKPASSNLTTVPVSAPGGVANTITLSGQLQDVPDGSLGDLSKAVVTVSLLPAVLGTPSISCTVTNAAGSLTASCPNVPVNAYAVQWSVSGDYYQVPQVNTVLAVYDPSLGFVTGGGSVVINGVPVDFSLSVKYQKNGSIGGGGMTLVLHQPGSDVRISSTVLNSMSIVGKTAVIDGLASVNGTGAVPIRVTVTDNGEPGIHNDLFGAEASPAISFSPNAIASGNIQMH